MTPYERAVSKELKRLGRPMPVQCWRTTAGFDQRDGISAEQCARWIINPPPPKPVIDGLNIINVLGSIKLKGG